MEPDSKSAADTAALRETSPARKQQASLVESAAVNSSDNYNPTDPNCKAREQQAILLELAAQKNSDFPNALRRILKADAVTLGIDRVSFWFFHWEPTSLRCELLYIRATDTWETGVELSGSDYPRYFQALTLELAIAANDAQNDPRTGEFAETYFRPAGITSMLDIPVWHDGRCIGVVCHEHTGPIRQWTLEEQRFAASIAQMITLAIAERERASAVQALHERDDRFRTVFENGPVGICLFGMEGEIIQANKRLADMLGYSIEELESKLWIELLHPDDLDPTLTALRPLVAGKAKSATRENRYFSKSGEIVWARATGSLIFDPKKAPKYFICMLDDISQRKRDEAELAKLNRQLVELSRQSGREEVAISVLHNVGNILNSINVSGTLLRERITRSKSASIRKIAEFLNEHAGNLPAFFADDSRGAQLPRLLSTLADRLEFERDEMLNEISHLIENIGHVKEVVAMQQSYARVAGILETAFPATLVEDALSMNQSSLTGHCIRIVRDYQETPEITVQRHKVLQILTNLIQNAKNALTEGTVSDRSLIIRIEPADDQRIQISVEDNGAGIEPENLNRIFAFGFTTRKQGHGFGLHSSALAAKELGGNLFVRSEGPGKGAIFTLELPARQLLPS